MKQDKSSGLCDLGIIGLGVMGMNLLLNFSDHGIPVTGYDNDQNKTGDLKILSEGRNITAASSLREFITLLKTPRIVILLVPAGQVVDSVIKELIPFLNDGDIIVDAGNSYFRDTERRIRELEAWNIHFCGTGVSGGEEGARRGPSIMPGGSEEAWKILQPYFESVAAKAGGIPCVAHAGTGAAGHFVKMVHNGIEYAIMQLISEVYDLMKNGLGMSNEELQETFTVWNTGKLKSYLIEITGLVLNKKDEDEKSWLIDKILDVAGQKGTGMWTVKSAMELQVPVPVIDIAVSMRDLSKYKIWRQRISSLVTREKHKNTVGRATLVFLEDALYCSIMLAYAQGFSMLKAASDEYGFKTVIPDIAAIWRGGCIIRSVILEDITDWLRDKNDFLLVNPDFISEVAENTSALREAVILGTRSGIPVPALMASLGYIDSFRSENLPVNLIQAQRDFFGSHTYQRTDREGTFHTKWD